MTTIDTFLNSNAKEKIVLNNTEYEICKVKVMYYKDLKNIVATLSEKLKDVDDENERLQLLFTDCLNDTLLLISICSNIDLDTLINLNTNQYSALLVKVLALNSDIFNTNKFENKKKD